MEMTVLVAALGIATLWIVGAARGEYYRIGRWATTMVVMCAVALQVYILRPAIVLDPFYLPWPLEITSRLLPPYFMLLFVTRGRSTPIRARATATIFQSPVKLYGSLEELEQRKLAMRNLTLPRYGH